MRIAVGYLQQLLDNIKSIEYGELATIVGYALASAFRHKCRLKTCRRYYAMDRDTRWERTRVAYEAMVAKIGEKCSANEALDAIKRRYEKEQTDEFLEPLVFGDDSRLKGKIICMYYAFQTIAQIFR